MSKTTTFDLAKLEAELLKEAKVVKIPAGTAKTVAKKVAEQVEKWVKKRPAVTLDDINRRVALEAAKYSDDLAYVYQNRGKII